jgi:hypothetical protein
MTLDEQKLYNVRVKNGSGCLFQPISQGSHTYILTAKHLFEGLKKDGDGNDIPYSTNDGNAVEIYRIERNGLDWIEVPIPFTVFKGSTYFPHDTADAAILKVDFIDGFDKIFTSGLPLHIDRYSICGFPSRFAGNAQGNKDTSYLIRNLIGPAPQSYSAQLISTTLAKADIEGMSGGPIMCIEDISYLSLIGIQSEMKHASWANGQINFVAMACFDEITEYPKYQDALVKLYPPYMGDFNFLRDDSFKLEVDAISESQVAPTRQLLRNKALKIIESDITPVGIKELFKNRLLIDEQESNCLSYKIVWIAWLEFLTIMNLIKYEAIDVATVSTIFDSYRLKYSHTDDWTKDLLNTKLSKSDYLGLKAGATVVVSSRSTPKRIFDIRKGRIIDIVKVYDKSGFRTDRGIDPFTSFDFIHIDYFKTKCILDKLEQYQNLDEAALITKLKQEYHDLFN